MASKQRSNADFTIFSISRFAQRRRDDGENLVEMDDGGMVDVDFDQTAHSGKVMIRIDDGMLMNNSSHI